MHHNYPLPCVLFLCLFVVAACTTTAESALIKPEQVYDTPPAYDYPINNPYAATVIGMPPEMKVDYSFLPQPSDRNLVIFKDRFIPEGFWYDNGLHYSELLQPKPAVLVYLIGGTGADSRSPTTLKVADILYSAGFSVVMLPSPTHPDFIINASENFVPGRPSQDAKDMYRAIRMIDPLVASETQITGHMIVGYSLGAINALFTAKIDDEQKSLNFSKVLLINPPLSVYSSMQTVDGLLYRSMPNGINDADHFIKNTVQRLSSANQSNDALDFSNERVLIDAYSQYKLGDNRLATMIGMSFRLASVNMIFTADVMGHNGYIFPKNLEFTTSTRMDDYMAVALRTRFKDYFEQIYVPKYQAIDPSLTRQEMIAEGSLESQAAYIAQHSNIGMMTNADDIILAPGEYNTLVNLFGRNAMTFPNGGHLGNISHPAVAYRIAKFLKE